MSAIPIKAIDEGFVPFTTEQVWSVLADVQSSPRWWPSAVKVTVLSFSPGLIGSELEIRPRGGRPFRCRVEAITPPHQMRMRYGNGFITGTGEWRLETEGCGTRVTYELDVVAKGWLVSVVGRVLPLGKIHSREMAEILDALEQETRRRISPDTAASSGTRGSRIIS